MNTYIGRQAIYNRDLVIDSYELLYRNRAAKNSAVITDEDAATRAVLSDAVTVFGLSQLTNNLPAYINFTRTLLLEDFAYLVDPELIVIEIPADIPVDRALEQKLSELRRAGYRLALDGYSDSSALLRFDRVIEMFDVIRINVRGLNRLKLSGLRRRVRRSNARFLAERIETEADFEAAMSLDFSLFQGYFFEKPVCLSKEIPALSASSYGKLLNALMLPSVNLDRCAELVHSDAILTYLFLRQLPNGGRDHLDSSGEIRQGIAHMGVAGLRHWAGLVLLKQNNLTRSEEVPRRAFLRGCFIEQLMQQSETELDNGNGFLLGLFSMLDQVMGVQLETLLSGFRFPEGFREALLGKEENEYSLYLQYAVIVEMENKRLILPDIHLKIEERQIPGIYMQCIADTDAAFEATQILFPTQQDSLF